MLNIDYIFRKFDYFYYGFLFILIFITLLHLEIFNYNNLIPLVFSIIIIYFLIKTYYYDEMNRFYRQNKIYENIDYSKYPNLNMDDSIILIVLELKPFYEINYFEYRKLLKELDTFILLYNEFLKNPNNNLYDNLFEISKNILNILNSFGVNIEYNKNIKLEKILNTENKLKKILSKYLTEMEIIINKKWISGDITCNDKPIYPDDIGGLSYNLSNYNIF